MRHRHGLRKLNRTSSHRLAMLRNMTNSLFTHEAIKTTLPKAKELRRVAEPLITLGKTPTLANRRLAFDRLRDRDVVTKLFNELGPRFKARPGGYLRILKFGFRQGDDAPMALIELVDRPDAADGRRRRLRKRTSRRVGRKMPGRAPGFFRRCVGRAMIRNRVASDPCPTQFSSPAAPASSARTSSSSWREPVSRRSCSTTSATARRRSARASRRWPAVRCRASRPTFATSTALRSAFHDHPIAAVVHCAGLEDVAESEARPLAYYDVNVGGTLCADRGDGRGGRRDARVQLRGERVRRRRPICG